MLLALLALFCFPLLFPWLPVFDLRELDFDACGGAVAEREDFDGFFLLLEDFAASGFLVVAELELLFWELREVSESRPLISCSYSSSKRACSSSESSMLAAQMSSSHF